MNNPRDPEEREVRSLELGPLLTRVFRAGRTWFVGLVGPLDSVSVATFQELVKRLQAEKCRSLVLDLRRVSYADSQGIRALLFLRDEIIQRRGRLRLVIPESSRVRRTLKLLRFDALFQIYGTPVEAWRSGRRERSEPPEESPNDRQQPPADASASSPRPRASTPRIPRSV